MFNKQPPPFFSVIEDHAGSSLASVSGRNGRLRGCTLARGLAQAAPPVDGSPPLPVVENPLASGSCSASRHGSSHPGPRQTPPAPAAHTQKTHCDVSSGGGQINSFLFSLPLCQMTQIICAAVTQCLAETKCTRGVYTLLRPRIYLFIFGCHMD